MTKTNSFVDKIEKKILALTKVNYGIKAESRKIEENNTNFSSSIN